MDNLKTLNDMIATFHEHQLQLAILFRKLSEEVTHLNSVLGNKSEREIPKP